MGDDIRAGDVVVCVDAAPANSYLYHTQVSCPLREGAVYRVSAIIWFENRPGILLTNVTVPHPFESFRAERFRKLDAAEDCFTKAMQELRPLETTREIHRCRDEVGL